MLFENMLLFVCACQCGAYLTSLLYYKLLRAVLVLVKKLSLTHCLPRCPPCPAPAQGLVPVYVLKKGGGEKKEVVCSLVRLQETTSGKSNSLVKVKEMRTGAKDLGDEESPRVKRDQGGKVAEIKDSKEEGGEAIELLDLSDKIAHYGTNHDIGEEDSEECKNSKSPDCNMAALMELLGGDLSVRKSDVEMKKNSHSHHSDFQQKRVEGDIDLGETIKDISEEEDRTVTVVERSSQEERELQSNHIKQLKTSSWSPTVVITAVFLISMAAFVVVASLLIRRLNTATTSNKVNIARGKMDPRGFFLLISLIFYQLLSKHVKHGWVLQSPVKFCKNHANMVAASINKLILLLVTM